nr:hypothetical protein [Tanacetum cinerariifolium]
MHSGGILQSVKGISFYNKRTRLIVESIHIQFDEIKEMSKTSVANDTSGLVPQRQKASNYDNSDPIPQLQNVFSLADAHVSSQQELDLLFGPLYDEFFTATLLRVVIPFKSSLGLVMVLPRSVPDPEDEAMLELMNLDIISVRLAN